MLEEEKDPTVFTREELETMVKECQKKLTDDQIMQGQILRNDIDVNDAVDIFLQHKKEKDQIMDNKSMKMVEKDKKSADHLMWIHTTLKIMEKENIAGKHGDIVIKYKKKNNRTDKRGSSQISPIQRTSRAKNVRV